MTKYIGLDIRIPWEVFVRMRHEDKKNPDWDYIDVSVTLDETRKTFTAEDFFGRLGFTAPPRRSKKK